MPVLEKKICANCKEESVVENFYLHPKTKKVLPVCKKCAGNSMETQVSAIEFCRENNVYFDMNLYQRAIVDAKKARSRLYFGYYLKILNMNKGTHMEKEFKDSVFEIPKETEEFHETKTFEARQKRHYCRYCEADKSANEFFASCNKLDSSGRLSVCKSCVKDIFMGFYQDHANIDCAIYETCAALNYGYHPHVIKKLEASIVEEVSASAAKHKEMKESEQMLLIVDAEDIFGRYLQLCSTMCYGNTAGEFNFYAARPDGYEDYLSPISIEEQIEMKRAEKAGNLKKKWGKSYSEEELEELEDLYSEWEQKKDLSDTAVSLLIRQLCMHQLAMENMRMAKEMPTKNDYDILMNLMSKAGATPNKVDLDESAAKQSWGTFIQQIEKTSPAEYIDKRKEKYFDVHNIEQYVNSLYTRSLKNFLTGSRDFSVVIDDTPVEGIEKESGDAGGKT